MLLRAIVDNPEKVAVQSYPGANGAPGHSAVEMSDTGYHCEVILRFNHVDAAKIVAGAIDQAIAMSKSEG